MAVIWRLVLTAQVYQGHFVTFIYIMLVARRKGRGHLTTRIWMSLHLIWCISGHTWYTVGDFHHLSVSLRKERNDQHNQGTVMDRHQRGMVNPASDILFQFEMNEVSSLGKSSVGALSSSPAPRATDLVKAKYLVEISRNDEHCFEASFQSFLLVSF